MKSYDQSDEDLRENGLMRAQRVEFYTEKSRIFPVARHQFPDEIFTDA